MTSASGSRRLAGSGVAADASTTRAPDRARLGEHRLDPLEVPRGDDARCSRRTRCSSRASPRARRPRRSRTKSSTWLARDQAVVDRDAHLAVLDELGADDTAHALGVDAVGGQDRRALAAELERDRHEVLGGRLGDLPADRRAAGVEQVIPAQRRELLRQRRARRRHLDPVSGERLVDHLPQQLGAGGRVVRGLDDHPVARGQHLDQRADGQVEREVPGHDVADHALGLVPDPGAARCRTAPGRRPARPRPSRSRAARSRRRRGRPTPSTSIRSVKSSGCTPKSALMAALDLVPVAHHHDGQRPEVLDPAGNVGIGIGQERCLLGGEQPMQLGDGRAVVSFCGSLRRDQGGHPGSSRRDTSDESVA